MNAGVWIALLFSSVAVFVMVLLFNRLVQSRNLVRAGLSDIDVQLQLRHDLIPQLVEAVKGYAGFERSLLAELIELRGKTVGEDPDSLVANESRLAEQLSRLVLLAEDYPELKAGENFRQLMNELSEVEDQLQHARRFYNGAVREYNTRVEQFPGLLIARPFGFRRARHFSSQIQARAVPGVNLDGA